MRWKWKMNGKAIKVFPRYCKNMNTKDSAVSCELADAVITNVSEILEDNRTVGAAIHLADGRELLVRLNGEDSILEIVGKVVPPAVSVPTGPLLTLSANVVGEMLRETVFGSEDFGCYTTFDVKVDARLWDDLETIAYWRDRLNWLGEDPLDPDFERFCVSEYASMVKAGQGLNFEVGTLTVDCAWYWDGDGVLTFDIISQGKTVRRLHNTDCKKDYRWEDLEIS